MNYTYEVDIRMIANMLTVSREINDDVIPSILQFTFDDADVLKEETNNSMRESTQSLVGEYISRFLEINII